MSDTEPHVSKPQKPNSNQGKFNCVLTSLLTIYKLPFILSLSFAWLPLRLCFTFSSLITEAFLDFCKLCQWWSARIMPKLCVIHANEGKCEKDAVAKGRDRKSEMRKKEKELTREEWEVNETFVSLGKKVKHEQQRQWMVHGRGGTTKDKIRKQ